MEERGSTRIRSTKTLILLSIVLTVLSGMVVTVSADEVPPIPNQFYGTVTIDAAPAPAGTVTDAYIDGEFRGSVVTTTAGEYGDDLNYLTVNGYESDDNKTIVFRINGVVADETDTYRIGSSPRIRNISVSDYEVPVVMNPNAKPASIVADGVQESRLNVTVIGMCGDGNVTVTVNLSAIGGPGAQVMECISDDVCSTIVNAPEGTALGTYRLRVNASDVDGKYNDGVCIELNVISSEVRSNILLDAGWNLISIPVIPADSRVDAIFGDKITPPVYEYDAGYKSVTSLEPKKGYWVLADSPVGIDITGTVPANLEVTVVPGWNLIGPVSPDVRVSSFANITPPVYGYDAGYKSATTMERTRGYWVLTSAETTLIV